MPESKCLYRVFHRRNEQVINCKLSPLSSEQVFQGSFRLQKKYTHIWAFGLDSQHLKHFRSLCCCCEAGLYCERDWKPHACVQQECLLDDKNIKGKQKQCDYLIKINT